MPNRNQKRQTALEEIEPFLAEWRARSKDGDAAFRDWAVEQLLWDENLSTEEIQEVTAIDGPGDMGIDGWYLAKESSPRVLYLVQSKNTRTDKTDLIKLRQGFIDLFDSRKRVDANEEAKANADDFAADPGHDVRIEFHVVTSDLSPAPLKRQASEAAEPILIFEREFECTFEVHDIEDLSENIRTSHEQSIDVDFEIGDGDFFSFITDSKFETVTAVIPASQIVRLFRQERANLFRLNPRYYQTVRTAVNKDVLDTLMGVERENFFLYNNGLTAVCDALRVVTSGGRAKIAIRNFQIVNGCQTTVTLYEAWRRGAGEDQLKGVQVLVRISAAPSIAPIVARSTNSQNPMKAEDFRANDERQVRLHAEFDLLKPRWFYENKRGVWATDYRSRQARAPYIAGTMQPRHIQIKDLGQACLAYLGSPADAADRARSIFNSSEVYNQVFPESVKAGQLLLPYLLYTKADEVTKTKRDTYIWAPYLRFAMVYAASRVLHSFLGKSGDLGYLSSPQSESLTTTLDEWATELMEQAFDALQPEVHRLMVEQGVGARSLVRQGDWLAGPVQTLFKNMQNRLDAEEKAARQAKLDPDTFGMRAAFPFPIYA